MILFIPKNRKEAKAMMKEMGLPKNPTNRQILRAFFREMF